MRVQSLLTLLVLVVAACGRERTAFAGKEQAETVSLGTRNFVDVTWDVAWQRDGKGADSLFLEPFRFVADREHVYVLDAGRNRIVALRVSTGEHAWSFPTDSLARLVFPTAVAALPEGGVAIWDSDRSALVSVKPDGTLLRDAVVPGVGMVSSVCALPDGSVLLSPLNPDLDPVLQLSRAGQILGRHTLPWKNFRKVPSLARQIVFAGHGDGCVAALTMGRGFSLFDGRFTKASRYVESFELPQVRNLAEGDMQQLVHPLVAASSATLVSDTLALAFEGTTDQAGRIIDYYSASSGRYLYSHAPPHPLGQFTRSGPTYFMLDGEMRLVALRPVRKVD
jgi:hypothetical protein